MIAYRNMSVDEVVHYALNSSNDELVEVLDILEPYISVLINDSKDNSEEPDVEGHVSSAVDLAIEIVTDPKWEKCDNDYYFMVLDGEFMRESNNIYNNEISVQKIGQNVWQVIVRYDHMGESCHEQIVRGNFKKAQQAAEKAALSLIKENKLRTWYWEAV